MPDRLWKKYLGKNVKVLSLRHWSEINRIYYGMTSVIVIAMSITEGPLRECSSLEIMSDQFQPRFPDRLHSIPITLSDGTSFAPWKRSRVTSGLYREILPPRILLRRRFQLRSWLSHGSSKCVIITRMVPDRRAVSAAVQNCGSGGITCGSAALNSDWNKNFCKDSHANRK